MKRRGTDRVSLVAGVSVTLVGVLLMLDQAGDLELSPGVLGAVLVGVAGLITLISGLAER